MGLARLDPALQSHRAEVQRRAVGRHWRTGGRPQAP
jgi:hypothetical protein